MTHLTQPKKILSIAGSIALIFILPFIPILGDIWFEFGNAIPETIGLTNPVLPDEAQELELPVSQLFTLERTGRYEVMGGTAVQVIPQNSTTKPVIITPRSFQTTFTIEEAGEYLIQIEGSGAEAAVLMPSRNKDIIIATISALIQVSLLVALYRWFRRTKATN